MAACANLSQSIENGNVSYSRDPTEQGHYVENTTVTVTCDEGYRGGGNNICQKDGNWSSLSLPGCASEPALRLTIACLSYIMQCHGITDIRTGVAVTETQLWDQLVLIIIFILVSLFGLLCLIVLLCILRRRC